MELMEQLVGGRSKIDIIPIVGMGGIGKTILARILYDSPLIKESFEIRGWVTISQTYKVQEVVSSILKDIGVPLEGEKDDNQHLYQSLYGRKYLIVLDDVWNTQAWDDIKMLFPNNNNGSRILLTTRHSKVAAYANSFNTYHEMRLLDEDSSWSLLCQEIFLQQNCPFELVEIGKEISRQCQGLPLAISAIGGHLKKQKQTEEYWNYDSENVSSVLKTTNDPCMEILILSYNYLPHHLKACFLYFGSFEEDKAINVSEIVKLWVAKGFVKPSGSNSMEEVAEEYLQGVIERNLVFVHEYHSFGKPKTCGIHDLFRAICIREAKREKFFCILDRAVPFDLTEIDSQRRWILISSRAILSFVTSCSATRSLFCNGIQDLGTIKLDSGLLKVLKFTMYRTTFPVEFLELVNLKYLELGHVLEIPSSIYRFRNLQTFIACSVDSMPSGIWEMPQLQHLQNWGFDLPDIPDVQGNETNAYVLKSLQTLSTIINFRCSREVLKRIPNLKTLNISYIPDVGKSFRFVKNLVYLYKRESLCCEFDFEPDNVLLKPAFPFSLKRLELISSDIPWEQMTIIGILPNLEVLKLKNGAMKGKLWETNDGEFKQLKPLTIRGSDLVEWKTEKDHFPRLEYLKLKFCKALDAIPSEIGEIPTLEILVLSRCSLAAESSANRMLGEDSDIELIIDNGFNDGEKKPCCTQLQLKFL